MKGLALDGKGDVLLGCFVQDADLTAQTVRTILGTNRGEWFLNPQEGLPFREMLVKNPDYDQIRGAIQDGLRQVDETFLITEFNTNLKGRILQVSFAARNADGQEIKEAVALAY